MSRSSCVQPSKYLGMAIVLLLPPTLRTFLDIGFVLSITRSTRDFSDRAVFPAAWARNSAAPRPCIRKPKLFQQRAEASSKFRANGCGLAPSLGRGLAIACLYRLGKTAPLLQTR